MLQIKIIEAIETYPIRLEILRKNIPLPYKFEGDLDSETFHLGVSKNNELIAVSSYMNVKNKNFEGNQYQLRGMATLKNYRGFGAGKLMLQEAFSMLKGFGIDYLWCNARIVAVDFYKKQGFQTYGDEFEIPIVGKHYIMFKKISND
ncbi:GNAT family N-acetyltransferase [Lutibacter sp.]|uniref:GNAT family N-acetyltransferase n=1 Tax=Lutibacter sp. TaxID=1925666 RepID=UPI0025BAFA9E|nr:GNAT family N-acetyltransferase [Lutibacter sp.]MCF6167292.1 GNAT family N-acetyltransferase [Lutibacter sp.]